MISDLILTDFLASNIDTPTRAVELKVAKGHLADTTDWQLQFNHLSTHEMYHEYKFVVNQLMFADIDDVKRFERFGQVSKAASVLLGKLRVSYQTQPGILDGDKQQCLDTVLSVHYLGIMFYHVVWQRAAAATDSTEKKGLLALFQRKPQSLTTTQVIQHCLYGTMLLLRQALFEKYVGYRNNTRVIWQYLNACYRFAVSNGWQDITVPVNLHSVSEFGKDAAPLTLQNIYFHCITVAITNPYACRRGDMLAIQHTSVEWIDQLIINKDLLEKPYLYIDLDSDQPPKVLTIDDTFNPFAVSSNCLFLMFSRLLKHLQQTINQAQPSTDSKINSTDSKINNRARQAKRVYDNIQDTLQPAPAYTDSHATCDVVLGFNPIHYILANKTSLGNLIQAHELPEYLKPKAQPSDPIKKLTTMDLQQENSQAMAISQVVCYDNQPMATPPSPNCDANDGLLKHLQVNSLIAIRKNDGSAAWQIGYIKDIQQWMIDTPSGQPANKTYVTVAAQVQLHYQNAIPCGVRIQNYGTRQPQFVGALLIPAAQANPQDSIKLLVTRFGYQVADKLVVRMGNKQINVRLTQLLDTNEDTQTYAFVRIQ